jgi:hypothetical protein
VNERFEEVCGAYLLTCTPLPAAHGKFSPTLSARRIHEPDAVATIIPLEPSAPFDTEIEAATYAYVAGVEWVRDHG